MSFKDCIGLGVAGNFAGHLEQANEAKDFTKIEVKEEKQPKAIFPFYLPKGPLERLSTYPLSHDEIILPNQDYNVQIEPEVAIIFDIEYSNEKVISLTPVEFAAYNDCSIRRPDANKISEKKNWGKCSKGISNRRIKLDNLSPGTQIDNYRIASFHISNGELHVYGEDSPILGYNYFHEKLVDWIIDRMNNQEDMGPAENISCFLKECEFPKRAVISIGATRYTEYGETNFLSKGDQSIVVVYNQNLFTVDEIKLKAISGSLECEGISSLIQHVS